MRQNVLAERLDISNNHMSGIETGKENPSLQLFVDICEILRVTPDYLLMGTMHSSNVPQSIVDGLQLCTDEDLDLIALIIEHQIARAREL